VSEVTSVGAALRVARELGVDRLDAQLLIAHLLRRERTWVLAHDEAKVDGQAAAALLARRAAGEPLAYLVGMREFHGLRLSVTPDVLVPRPDTEALVDWAIELLDGRAAPAVVDLGTGSGAIALSVKHACPWAKLHAVDRSASALAVAQANAVRLSLDVAWHLGRWWSALPAGLFFALVPEGDRGDGLADIERICAGARGRLLPGAWLLLEHGPDQAACVRQRLQAIGLADVHTRNDLAGRPRVSGGLWVG
jgi:release factor glutamine methyltransferase